MSLRPMSLKNSWKIALPLAALVLVPGYAAVQAASETDTYRELDALMDVFERVRVTYVDQVDDKTLIRGAINGMLASLDPHSAYLDGRDYAQLKTSTDGEYSGLGLTVTSEDGAVKVVTPTDDTPAAKAGIKAGDFITHLDDELIYGSSLNEAVDKMRGPAGTKIKLTVVRPGEPKPLEFTLTRQVVVIKPVKWEVKGQVGVIRISTFNNKTGDATRAAVEAIRAKMGDQVAGYIIDLRSNPGGLLDEAIKVSDTFLEAGEVVSERRRAKNDVDRYFAKPGDATGGKPLVVLVDEGSASAAEIVAGALQDHRRALVLGQRSFGKGSVQTVYPLSSDTALRLTTARYFTPSGRSVQESGIEPDIQVPQLSDPRFADRKPVREADLKKHLINEVRDTTDRLVEQDAVPDPRFVAKADDLKARGVLDYQLDYAVKLVGRLAPGALPAVQVAGAGQARTASR
jgi:carboxyl-terminal processing protease